MNAVSVPLEDVGSEMATVDIVITCTGATQNIILKKDIQPHINTRSSDIHILDLGLPRDVEPTVADLENVRLFTLEDLQRLQTEHQKSIGRSQRKSRNNRRRRRKPNFIDDIEIQPLLKDIGESAERIRAAELQRTLSKLQNIDPNTREALDAMTRSMVKRILARPHPNPKTPQPLKFPPPFRRGLGGGPPLRTVGAGFKPARPLRTT